MQRAKYAVGITAMTIGAILVLTAVVLIGWQVGWWFRTQDTNRTAHLYRSSYGNQQTLRDTITAGIAQVTTDTAQITLTSGSTQTALKAERYAHTGQICSEAAQVTGDALSPDQQGFISANCSAGAVSPSSEYAPH